MKKKVFVFMVILLFSSIIAVAEAKSSRTIEKRVFIHKAKPDKPDKPGNDGGGGGRLWYKYSGIHWAEADLPVDYVVNLAGSELDPDYAFAIIVTSFETWDSESATEIFGTGIKGDVEAGDRDSVNGISFGDYPNSGVIAVTYIWYWSDTGEIVEVDTLFDTDYTWSISPGGVSGTMDLQNIATHEFGHWLVLDDLYMKPANQQTMYGYSTYGETIKQSLENGDIAGLEEIYGP